MPEPQADNEQVRDAIVEQFARWTAVSALRSGAPIKSADAICRVIDNLKADVVFDTSLGPLSVEEFDAWHEVEVGRAMECEPRLEGQVGWAAKILNVYLKTRVYVAGQGRWGAIDAIHPPVDSGLWRGVRSEFSGRPHILSKTHCVAKIKDISNYSTYQRLIEGFREVANLGRCRLIEVEQYWAWAD